MRIEGDPTVARLENRDKRDLNHISETDLDNYQHFDYILYNDGSLQELSQKVEAMLSQLVPVKG